jgi:glucuronoarabinoxylan endo-1,4-beta-xylanase
LWFEQRWTTWHAAEVKYCSISKASWLCGIVLIVLALISLDQQSRAQNVLIVDQFNPAGSGGNNYADGQIGTVWGNWFGDAFQSLAWDPSTDAGNNPDSGSMEISLYFSYGDGNSQFEVFDYNGIYPTVNGTEYTNFQCDVLFAPGSATVMVDGTNTFGYLQFGVDDGGGQDYFGGVLVAATNTDWVAVSLPINAASDPNLANIYNILIHMYGPYFGPGLNGPTTLWVDNIQFAGLTPVATNCVVDWNNVCQRIDGFGASSAWQSTWTSAQAHMFFSTNPGTGVSLDGKTNFSYNGIGLSLLRSRIAPGGTTVESNIMIMAQSLGAKVWSTPWSPAAQFTSGDSVDGGDFVSTNYQAYASQLAGYVATMKKKYGVNIYAVSVQNEPDVSANYESCIWTAQQIHDFVPYLYAALAASNVASTKIVLAEDESWQTDLYSTAMSDPAVAPDVGIVACHDYDGSPPSNVPAALPTYENPDAALWETEVSTFDPYDGSITNAMYWAERIHLYMTDAQVNAFHFWWLISDNSDNEGLTSTNGIPAKRMYVLGNYSRFVRPGFYRIGVANNAFTSISAYKSTNTGSFAIVAVNSSSTPVTQTFNLTNFTAASVTPWVTSGTLSLESQASVAVSNASFAYSLPALSVVTFVGKGYVLPPSITISNAAFSTNGLVLTWASFAGATYSVLKSSALTSPTTNWTAIVTGFPAGDALGGLLSFTDTAVSLATNFYQLRSP